MHTLPLLNRLRLSIYVHTFVFSSDLSLFLYLGYRFLSTTSFFFCGFTMVYSVIRLIGISFRWIIQWFGSLGTSHQRSYRKYTNLLFAFCVIKWCLLYFRRRWTGSMVNWFELISLQNICNSVCVYLWVWMSLPKGRRSTTLFYNIK